MNTLKKFIVLYLSILRYPAVKLAIAIAFILLGLTLPSSAATLDNSSVHATSYYIFSPIKILKCQAVNIYANYSDFADIVTVTAILQERDGTQAELLMIDNGGGHWIRTYGNDNTTQWGNKSISFRVNTAGGSYINTTNNHIFVYSDDCSGSNLQSWRNTSYSSGYGNYTRPLFTGEKNLITFSLQPYEHYWGYTFYLLMMFTMMGILYLKTQSVSQPIIMSFITIAVVVSSGLIPTEIMDRYASYIMMFMALALAAIFWRLFKSS